MTTFYFVRHGQTTANATGLKQGTINDDRTHLTALGHAQATHLADQFDVSNMDALFVSPLDRTQETAAHLHTDLQPQLDKRLLEISYGSWDGQQNADLQAKYPEVFDQTLNDVLPTYTTVASDGESFDQVQARIADFMADVETRYPNGNVVCVTHGFTVKSAALVALQPQDPMSLPEPDNTSVTKIAKSGDHYYLWYYNRFDAQTY
ncbi:histidine phosphatase family protein [Lacticaseibacillus porcinae]|uniref:histidine phosphatase family protein n=1 Tax=Lacticaseibacillus porcinae TaxID=1123687 RepID=UPI000F783392|nr:histidine phosphatase family protein [Lacticaseibacillus porcinae]